MSRSSEDEVRYQRRSISFDIGLYAEALEMSYDENKDSNFEILNQRVSKKASWNEDTSLLDMTPGYIDKKRDLTNGYDVILKRLANRLTTVENAKYIDYFIREKSFLKLPKIKEKSYLKKQDSALIEQYNIKCYFGVEKLSEAGFYYDEDEELIKCFYCSKRASRKSYYEDIWKQHLTNCNFVMYLKGYKFFVENCKLDEIKFEILMKNDYIYGVKEEEMDEPNYQTFKSRLETFQDVSFDNTSVKFAEAGFFCNSVNNVKCFFCGLILKNWKQYTDRTPLEYHAHFSKTCFYVITVAGQIFADTCRNDQNFNCKLESNQS
ncbi:DgyrCDS2770 [Dimorphilus gyrociliatus]|uniref:DgyrCDS2770 n=1 Tax=Dimorphilus gyrociliatus TaxID=2664684 RepID=A0A7I8VD75_9ANNE|nr:DgyrCDS2770 [Dimorphilus gyrociliatus]